MWDWITDNPWVLWVALAVLLAVVEMMSLDLVLLMFALGALAAAVASALGGPLWVAVLVFAVLSFALLFLARPPMVAKLHAGPTLTQGHDALVGRTAVVVDPVSSFGGRVQLASELWSARSLTQDETFEPGTEVLVTKIDGATAVVTLKES